MTTTTALDRNPSTTDGLLQNRFKFLLRRCPNVQFWVQDTMVPGFSLGRADQPTPFVSVPHPGNRVHYDPLGIRFQVDSSLANYLEIYNWLRSIGKPESLEQYAPLLEGNPRIDDTGVTSEVVLTLLNGQNRPQFEVVFHDAWPSSLGSLDFTTTNDGLARVYCNVQFEYSTFDLTALT